MKINFNQNILDAWNREIVVDKTDTYEGKPMTLGMACMLSLLETYQDEKIDKVKKLFRDELARKIFIQGEMELTPEETVEIKECLDKRFGPIVYGPAIRMIEKATSPLALVNSPTA